MSLSMCRARSLSLSTQSVDSEVYVCNTLQHTATHSAVDSEVLIHTDLLQCVAVCCRVLQCVAIMALARHSRCNTLQHPATLMALARHSRAENE